MKMTLLFMVTMLFHISLTVKQLKVTKNIQQLIKALSINLAVKKIVINSNKTLNSSRHNLAAFVRWA